MANDAGSQQVRNHYWMIYAQLMQWVTAVNYPYGKCNAPNPNNRHRDLNICCGIWRVKWEHWAQTSPFIFPRTGFVWASSNKIC